MGRTVFRRTSPSFAVGLVAPSHPRRGGLGRRSTGLPESVAAICGALNLREISATSAFAEIAPPPCSTAAGTTASSSVCGYGVAGWLPLFFMRSFELSLKQVSWYYSGIALVGGIAGIWLGGMLADKLGNKREALRRHIQFLPLLIHQPQQVQSAVQPPSTLIVVPVIWSAASEHRNTVVPPIWLVVANWRDGWRVSMTSRITVSRSMLWTFICSGICASTSGVIIRGALVPALCPIRKIASACSKSVIRPTATTGMPTACFTARANGTW